MVFYTKVYKWASGGIMTGKKAYFIFTVTILKSDHTSQIHARLEMRSQNCFKKPDIGKLSKAQFVPVSFSSDKPVG